MNNADRFRQIRESMEGLEAEPEIEGGHEEVSGGSETPPAEEGDEITAPSLGEAGEAGEASEAGLAEVELEAPEGAAPTIPEVEGFELEAEPEICCPPELTAEVAEIVHGRDDRVRVWNTRAYPWRTICHLQIRAANGRQFICTGSFIGPRVVLTAGHCIYLRGNGGWARSIRVIPGRNASTEPFGSATATRYISVKGWVQDGNSNYDYGVIILPSNRRLGNTVGWMGLANLSFFSLLWLRVNGSGYPGDKPYGTQWWNANNILAVTGRRFYYRIDTAGGQSGSPVWRYRNGQRHIVGIHTTGSPVWNGATRIVKRVFDNLVKWKNM